MKNSKLQIVYLPIDELTPYEKNARRHTDVDVSTIMESIKQFGMNDPIGIWSEKNIIVEGHGRLLACKKLGYKEVPCIRLDHLTSEERRAYGLAHNKTAEMSSWDEILLTEEAGELKNFKLEDFGFTKEDFVNLSDKEEAADDDFDIDAAVARVVEPKAKIGDLFRLGSHYLMCGDSMNPAHVGFLMGGELANLLFTDPPYNVNVENSEGMKIKNDNLEDSSFRKLLDGAFSCAASVLKPGGAFYVWHADSESVNFRDSLKGCGLVVKQCLIWVKNGFNFGRQDFKWQHEPCLYGWKDGAAHFFVDEYNHSTVIDDTVEIDKMSKEELRAALKKVSETIPSSVIHEDKPLKNDLHPTMKPLRMCGRLIKYSSKKGDLVLDVFGGSGSTLIVCEQLDRVCRMMELDPIYVDVIINRWESFTGKKAELIAHYE